jgi:hypothetical protein
MNFRYNINIQCIRRGVAVHGVIPRRPPEVDEPPGNDAGIETDGPAHIVSIMFIVVVIAAPFFHPFPLSPPPPIVVFMPPFLMAPPPSRDKDGHSGECQLPTSVLVCSSPR